MSKWTRQLKPIATAVWHFLLAVLLAYAFTIVLMISSSQAGVTERLARLAPPLDYSAAHPLWREGQEVDDAIRGHRVRISRLNADIETATQAAQGASDDSLTAAAPLLSLHPQLSTVPQCKFDAEKTTPLDLAKALNIIRYCLPDANLSPAFKNYATKVSASDSMVAAGEKWLRLQHAVLALSRQRGELQANLAGLRQKQAELKPIVDAFGEVSALQRNWILGGGMLIEFPPSMTQIVLAFVSGLFGSLLLTLVLIVYPKTDMKLGATDKGYGPRILLGGLISLCVFVVIGGGTAVLGTNNALSGGESNFLALCAIGILAGMFSDRVAAWLSERADTFFRLTAQQAATKAAAKAQMVAVQRDAIEQHERIEPGAPRGTLEGQL